MKRRSFITACAALAAFPVKVLAAAAQFDRAMKRTGAIDSSVRWQTTLTVYCHGRLDDRCRVRVWNIAGFAYEYPGCHEHRVLRQQMAATTNKEVTMAVEQWAPQINDWHEYEFVDNRGKHVTQLVGYAK